MVLYNKERWSYINYKLKRLKKVNSVLNILYHTELHEIEDRGIYRTFEWPKTFVDIVSDRAFW